MHKLLAVAVFALFASAPTPNADRHYLEWRRSVQPAASGDQYLVVDEDVWKNSKSHLDDLRIYSGDRELPYARTAQAESAPSANIPARITNKGTINGHVRFDVERPQELAELDHIALDLTAPNFVAQAAVEGQADDGSWVSLGKHTIYDFQKEDLGRNFVIRFDSPLTYAKLRIELDGPIKPDQVQGADVSNRHTQKAEYLDLAAHPVITNKGASTLVEWQQDEQVPLERVQFEVDGTQNFSRNAVLRCADKPEAAYLTSFDLVRLHIKRNGQTVDRVELTPSMSQSGCAKYRIEIANGNDVPLQLTRVVPQMLERRLYFNAPGQPDLSLYYGDKLLTAPTYDYAKFFDPAQAKNATQAQLGRQEHNPEFTARPDDRAWSEKHQAVLWVAMVIAVLALGAVAIKGFK